MNCARAGPEAKILTWNVPRGLAPPGYRATCVHWTIWTFTPFSTTDCVRMLPGASSYKSSQKGNRPKLYVTYGSVRLV
jgi:hypothetical protein